MKLKYLAFLLIITLIFNACESDLNSLVDPYTEEVSDLDVTPPNYTSGTADFSQFVAIGNSLTAGFSDGALFINGQENSFPNLLAQRFSLAGGGAFSQPLMSDNVGGLLFNGVEQPGFGPRLIFDAVNQTPVPLSGAPSTELFNVQPGPYNNMGVPGAKSFHLLFDGYGDPANLGDSANPYFLRMASAPNATVLGDALALNPTFFSFWIGGNDVLGYAYYGGDSTLEQITPLTGGVGFGFTETYNFALGALVNSGAEGVVTNIPYVTDAPFFTTVPYAPLDPSNPSYGPLIPTLNAIYGQLNQIFAAVDPSRVITFSETEASAVVINDESLDDLSATITGALLSNLPAFEAFIGQFGLPPAAAPQVAGLLGLVYGRARQATANDLLVLTSSSVIGTVNTDFAGFLVGQGLPPDLAGQFAVEGVTLPLADQWVLISSEQTEITDATNAFNQVISDAANTFGVPLFDLNTFFHEVATTGVQDGNAFMTADFVTGGTFSLDGIHTSPRGNAVVTNQMIEVINTEYGSNLPNLNPVDFTGVYLD